MFTKSLILVQRTVFIQPLLVRIQDSNEMKTIIIYCTVSVDVIFGVNGIILTSTYLIW